MFLKMSRLLPLLLLLVTASAHAESYLCTAEQLAGFIYDPVEQSWKAGASVTEATFIVKHTTEDGSKNIGPAWFVSERDKEFGIACQDEFDERGFLYCRGLGGDFMMNKKTLRFRHINDSGYVVDEYKPHLPEGKQAPYMKIGTCKPY